MSRSLRSERLFPMKKPMHPLIAEIPRSVTKVGMTIGIDLGDVWSHYCTLNEDGEVVDRGRSHDTLGSREVVYRCAQGTGCDGGWDPFDLGQRTTPRTGPRSNRGQGARAQGDLAQRPQERHGGCGKDRSLCPARSGDPATDLPSHGCTTGSSDLDSCPQPDRSSADGGCELRTWAG
jgi:hypothetical protein